jgi:hypothetical protein
MAAASFDPETLKRPIGGNVIRLALVTAFPTTEATRL